MLHIACGTIDFQRVAARRRLRHAGVALLLARGGAPALLAGLAFCALRNGHAGSAGALLLLAVLAGALAGPASRAGLARIGWAGLSNHCLILARRAAARRASVRARALARALDYLFSILGTALKLIIAVPVIIIGNRLLANVCISPRIKSQRPN